MKDGFYFDNFKITSDPNNFILEERRVCSNSKDKNRIGKETWDTVGYFSSLNLVFTRLANRLCSRHIGELSIAIKKIEELKKMVKNLTEFE